MTCEWCGKPIFGRRDRRFCGSSGSACQKASIRWRREMRATFGPFWEQRLDEMAIEAEWDEGRTWLEEERARLEERIARAQEIYERGAPNRGGDKAILAAA